MTIHQLEYFLEVSRSLSYARAAEKLYISQPALSRSIASLEKELGVQLLSRDRHRVELTAAGMVLAESIPKLGADLSRIVAEVQQTDMGQKGKLRFGILDGVPLSPVLLRARAKYEKRYPLVEFLPVCLCMEELVSAIKGGELDMISSYEPEWTTDTTLLSIPLHEERFAVALAETHPMAATDSITLKDLRKESFFLAGTDLSFEIHRWKEICTKQGFMPRFATVINTSTLMLSVELGYGYAILPESHMIFYRPGIKQVKLNEPFGGCMALRWDASNLNPCIDLFVNIVAGETGLSLKLPR